jgi:hypothetical protein
MAHAGAELGQQPNRVVGVDVLGEQIGQLRRRPTATACTARASDPSRCCSRAW